MLIDDVRRAIAFYRDVLGFEVVTTAPGDVPAWALLRHGQVELMFQSREGIEPFVPPGAARPAPARLTIYVDLDDVDAFYHQLDGRAPLVHGLHETGYGTREFSVRDCHGFVLTFAGPLPAARRAA